MRLSSILLLLLILTLAPLSAQETGTDFAPLWIEKDGVTTAEAVQDTLDQLHRQQPDPEQIFVLVHGFKKPRAGSTRDFNILGERLREQFEGTGTRLGLVGVQWDSSTGIEKAKGLDALRMIRAYHETVPLARSVGRGPTRALLLALQERYPKAHITVFAHSMGCEVAAAAVLPEIEYEEYQPFVEAHRPDDDVKLDMLVLAGSDLDYDFWYKSKISPREMEGRTRLIWLTVADYLTKGDKVLNTRRRIRGRAGGSSFPRLTLPQLDQTVSERRLFLDQKEIPRSHQFLDYYEEDRLSRIVGALRYLTEPRAPQPDELAELDEILAAPNELSQLLTYLDRPGYAAKFYAMWRVERENCGDARHMTDLTLDKVVEYLRHEPKKIDQLKGKSECLTVKSGQFPTPKTRAEAGLAEDQDR